MNFNSFLFDNRAKKINLLRNKSVLDNIRLFNNFLTILKDTNNWHIPVLLNELISNIKLNNEKNVVVDCTLWLAWHAIQIISKMNNWDIFVWFDADKDNLETAKQIIEKNVWDQIKNKNIKTYFINSNFKNIRNELNKLWIDKVNNIYYDLWVSSVHFDDSSKWFSFREEWPLDMRFDRNSWITAKDFINNHSEFDLYRVFKWYWEEKKAKFIIDEILKQRKIKEISTTKDLLEIIEKSSFDPKSKTRVFQAIRMEVNDELGSIEKSLREAVDLLEIWWILEVITFHSIEDRLVKKIIASFIETEKDQITGMDLTKPILEKVFKKPIEPSLAEIQSNPRSRSAKLRVAKKINNIT